MFWSCIVVQVLYLYCWLFLIRNLLCWHCLPSQGKTPLVHTDAQCKRLMWFATCKTWPTSYQHVVLVCCQKKFQRFETIQETSIATKHRNKKMPHPGALHPVAFRLHVLIIQDKSCLWTVSWKGLRGDHSSRWPAAAVYAFVDSCHTANGVSPHCKTSLHTLSARWRQRLRKNRGVIAYSNRTRVRVDDPQFTYGCVWPLLAPSSLSSPSVSPSHLGRRPFSVFVI